MQQAIWLLLAFAAADDPKVLEVGKGLKISGMLDKAKQQQVYHVKLDKGGTYVIDMISPNPKALDPFLRLLDGLGKTLAFDDDGGGGLNARILFLAPATGTYQIVATSFGGTGMGPFTLTITEDDAKLADALEGKVKFLLSKGNDAEALETARELLKVRSRLQGPKHWKTVDAQWHIRTLEKIAALPAKAKAELAKAKKLNDAEAFQLYQQGKYAEAGVLVQKALDLRRKLLGEEHPDTGESYANLAHILYAQGKYAEAGVFCQKSLDLCRKLLGEEHPHTAGSYHNLAVYLSAQRKYPEAGVLSQKALDLYRKLLGEEHRHTATSYGNLALDLNAQGKYAEAGVLLQTSLDLRRKLLGEDHPDTATSYDGLANNLNAQGKYAEAGVLFQKALDLRRKLLGEHRDTATSYNNLAVNLDAQSKHAEAGLLYQKALALRRELLGEQDPRTATSYHNLALNLNAQGKYAEAGVLFQTSLDLRHKLLGERHPDTATSYDGLATNLNAQGKYATAGVLFQKALELRRTLLGEEHRDTADSQHNLAFNLNAQGKYAEAEESWDRASRVFAIARLRSSKTGFERAAFATQSPMPFLTVCQARTGKPLPAWQNLEASLARGLLEELNEGSRLSRPISADERSREQELLAKLDLLDRKVLALVTAKNKDNNKELEKLLAQRRQAGEELAKLEVAVAARQVYDLKRIQNSTPTDAAWLAWVDLKGQPKAKDPNGEHWACVLRHSGPPAWVKLPGSGDKGAWTKDDDELPERFRKAVSDPTAISTADLKVLKEKLLAQRLAPLAPHLAAKDGLPAVRRLIVVPVGVMAGVPVEAISDDRIVSYVPSGTMWARLKEQGRLKIDPTMLAVGDPKFRKTEKEVAFSGPPPKAGILIIKVLPDCNAAKNGIKNQDVLLRYGVTKLENPASLFGAIKEQSNNAAVELTVWRAGKTFTVKVPTGPLGIQIHKEPAEQVILAQRDAERVIRASHGADYTPLPGSRAEVEAIAKLLPKEATLKLLGSEASEQKLADLAERGELKKYRYLHFATHGEVNSHIAFQSAIILAQDQLPEPAEALRGKNFIDGRLAAAELMNWQLDADMVVLSACQTGLGQPAGGEGFLGFSQALFKAGARSLVVSLWKVDDTATALLMVRFYENLLGRRAGLKAPMPKAEALAEAKHWLRGLTTKEAETLAKNLPPVERIGTAKGRPLATTARPYEHPYYWAAFILIGDPR